MAKLSYNKAYKLLFSAPIIKKCKIEEFCLKNIPSELISIFKKYLHLKINIFKRIRFFDCKYVPFGLSCFPANFCAKFNLSNAYSEDGKYIRQPFDLASYDSTHTIIDILRTNFCNYAKYDNIKIQSGSTVKDNFFVMRSHAVKYNHDIASNHVHDIDFFLKILNDRINNFRILLTKNNILFMHHARCLKDIKHIDAFHSLLRLQENNNYLFILVFGKKDNFEEYSERMSVLHVAAPNKYRWSLASNQTTEFFFELQKKVAMRMISLVQRKFPHKAQDSIISVKTANRAMKTRIADEIAENNAVKQYLQQLPQWGGAGPDTIGAVVVNCNPFTLGHRYLIEWAADRVTVLLVFVVEEDLSFFSFTDRFAMVCAGTSHLANVRVVPGGKFIISTATFPSYFSKDNPTVDTFDATSDVEFFGRVIAPAAQISIRFVGTEPDCRVTSLYNQQLQQVLPQYGILVEEVPRIETGGLPISASRVREFYKINDFASLKNLVPESSYDYLQNLSPARA